MCTNHLVCVSAQYLRPQQSGELVARKINVRIMCIFIMVSMNWSKGAHVPHERAIHAMRCCIFVKLRSSSPENPENKFKFFATFSYANFRIVLKFVLSGATHNLGATRCHANLLSSRKSIFAWHRGTPWLPQSSSSK